MIAEILRKGQRVKLKARRHSQARQFHGQIVGDDRHGGRVVRWDDNIVTSIDESKLCPEDFEDEDEFDEEPITCG